MIGFASSFLALNWVGLGLMLLSVVLFVLNVKLPAHGLLTVGSVVSLVVGAFILFDGSNTSGGQQIYAWLVYGTGALIGSVGFVLMSFVVRAQRRPVLNGVEGMPGAQVIALTALTPEGRVNYMGENWAAVLAVPGQTVHAGTELQIVAVEGLRLRVRPVHTNNRVGPDANSVD